MTAQPAPLTTHAEPVMGTVFSFTAVHGDLPPDAVRAALAAACRELHHCDALFSTWDPDSPVSRFRRGEAALGQMPPEFTEVLGECRAAKEASGGGDVAVFGSPADGHRWRVGIRHPWRADALACVIEAGQGPVTGERGLEPAGGSGPWGPGACPRGGGVPPRAGIAAVATSGPYERGAHLIDPA